MNRRLCPDKCLNAMWQLDYKEYLRMHAHVPLLLMEVMLRTRKRSSGKERVRARARSEESKNQWGRKGGSEVWTLAPHTAGYRTHA